MTSNRVRTSIVEPVVMWRMTRGKRQACHLVIGRDERSTWAAWFLNGKAIGVRDFADMTSAISFSERMQFQNWSVGWRLENDLDDQPPSASA